MARELLGIPTKPRICVRKPSGPGRWPPNVDLYWSRSYSKFMRKCVSAMPKDVDLDRPSFG